MVQKTEQQNNFSQEKTPNQMQEILKKFMENTTIQIMVSNNADLKQLPDLKHVQALVHGKEPATHICKKGVDKVQEFYFDKPQMQLSVVK